METLWGRGRMVSQGLVRRFPRQQDQLYSTQKDLSTPLCQEVARCPKKTQDMLRCPRSVTPFRAVASPLGRQPFSPVELRLRGFFFGIGSSSTTISVRGSAGSRCQ